MEDEEVSDTRVFVSGLPPTITSDELGKHFARRYQITDAQVIPGRRIGFVGFRNYTLAKSAVTYFNKSYIRMSKILVDLAKPVDAEHQEPLDSRPRSKGYDDPALNSSKATNDVAAPAADNQASVSTKSSFQPYVPVTAGSNALKRKRPEEEDPKLKEYLEVMQPARKSKSSHETNGNPTMMGAVPTADVGSDAAEQKAAEKAAKKKRKEEKREECRLAEKAAAAGHQIEATTGTQEAMKTRKKKKDRVEGAGEPSNQDEKTTNQRRGEAEAGAEPKSSKKTKSKDISKGGVETLDDEHVREEPRADGSQRHIPTNDADWLRSKTSRLLDLVDEDELPKLLTPSKDLGSEVNVNGNGAQDAASSVSSEEGALYRSPDRVNDQDQEGANRRISDFNGRLFVRNLPYDATEADLQRAFSKYGKLEEVHIVRDSRSNVSKGFAYVEYIDAVSSSKAAQELDGKGFQGRLLHVLPASAKRTHTMDEFELSKLPLKKQKLIKQKAEAGASSFAWNSLYMNPDAVMSSVADRLGISKSDVLDPTSSEAAVKQAQAETHIIQETQAYLSEYGVNLEAFKSRERGNKALLVKNFTYGVTSDELRKIFDPFGEITRLLLPPSGTMAIVEFADTGPAQQAFKSLAYRNFKGSPLFLEKAPQGLLMDASTMSCADDEKKIVIPSTDQGSDLATSTLFVRNLNFSTTTARLTEVFKPLDGFRSATVKTRTDVKRPGEILSMGFGFVEFNSKSQAQAALAAMNGYVLEKHDLQIKASTKVTDAAEERRKQDQAKKAATKRTKIIIKNLPFEATKKDIRSLFGSYGQLRSVRVPKKFDNSTRGFGFADFVTIREAENAMDALKNTHLLGRRLVLDFASEDATDPEEEIRAIEKKVGDQVNRVQLKNLMGSGRKKFSTEARDDLES